MSLAVSYFGSFDPQFSRNHILIDGLKKNRVKVILTHASPKLPALIRYLVLLKRFITIHHRVQVIFVGFSGYFDLPLAWLLGRLFAKPVIFDAFISLYDTYTFDRQAFTKTSLKAKFFWWIDKLTCSLADFVTLDTQAHIDYFSKTFKLDKTKFHLIPIGGDDSIFKPRTTLVRRSGGHPAPRTKTIVEFHGMFTRTQGAEVFVKAAKLLENHSKLEFWLIGDSQNYRLPLKLYHSLRPKNMKYWPRLAVKKLAQKVAQADITVAHLGKTAKARRVISFKLMHGLSVANAVIAPATPATQAVFTPKTHCLMIPRGDSQTLAQAIRELAAKPSLRLKLQHQGHRLHQRHYTNLAIGRQLKQLFTLSRTSSS